MKIKSIELTGFRGFAQKWTFDLDADTVIIVGANGRGKTSLFDGIFWALTGKIPRLADENAIISKYSESGEAYVSLALRGPSNDSCIVSRSFDGEKQRLRLQLNGDVIGEPFTTTRLLEKIWPEALLTANGVLSLTTAITRSAYLQQDLVRQFIEADTDKDRFESVGELVGAGRVTELQLALERARNAWTRATTSSEKERDQVRVRLLDLKGQLSRLASGVSEAEVNIDAAWAEWWRKSLQLGISIGQVPSPSSLEAPSKINQAMKQFEVIQHSVERKNDLLTELLSEIESRSTMTIPDEEVLRKALGKADKELQIVREQLAEAESQAAEERQRKVELREAREELRAMAQLALRHLKAECPVCGQEHDRLRTRQRLEELIGAPADESEELLGHQRVMELASVLKDSEKARAAVDKELQKAMKLIREYHQWLEDRNRRLKELQIETTPSTDITTSLNSLTRSLRKTADDIRIQQKSGEELALTLARASELARRAEVENQIKPTEKEFEDFEKSLQSRYATSELVGRILDGLRDAAYFVVEEQLGHIESLVQQIYATIDPHPSFRAVKFLTSFYRGRGLLGTEIKDPFRDVSSDSPQSVLSSSQMNALAVSVFLAFNLGVKSLPIEAAMLDDPLQSLDDVNLLGLIDLLRRVRDKRQLFVSTHDARFGKLLELKLRPVHNQRTVVVEFTGWDREGPTIDCREIKPDLEPLRIPNTPTTG